MQCVHKSAPAQQAAQWQQHTALRRQKWLACTPVRITVGRQQPAVAQVYHHLKAITKKKYGQDSVNVGDEGGFAPNVKTAEEALDVINAAIEVPVSSC